MSKQRRKKIRVKENGQLKPPKGAYRVPEGGYMVEGLSVTTKSSRGIRVVAHHEEHVDVEATAKIVIDVAKRLDDEGDDVGGSAHAMPK